MSGNTVPYQGDRLILDRNYARSPDDHLFFSQRFEGTSGPNDLLGADLSFTGCLNSSGDYHVLESSFDLSSSPSAEDFFGHGDVVAPATATVGIAIDRSTSGGVNAATPNSSMSSSSIEAVGDEDSGRSRKYLGEIAKADDVDDGTEKPKKPIKPRKKGEKRPREPRFAFMTKSEVDHLEDGYRWRKYGQKAVKNSPYPRSYYRCTTPKCSVKKRVERSHQDPSIVITTYEGQHTHHSPATIRGSSHVLAPSTSMAGFCSELLLHHRRLPSPLDVQLREARRLSPQSLSPYPATQHPQCPPDYGLLQDVVPFVVHHAKQ